MYNVIATAPTPLLLADVARLEAKIIEGQADALEIDRYVLVQLELAERTLLDTILDPRD